jgi:hypothetical protein
MDSSSLQDWAYGKEDRPPLRHSAALLCVEKALAVGIYFASLALEGTVSLVCREMWKKMWWCVEAKSI